MPNRPNRPAKGSGFSTLSKTGAGLGDLFSMGVPAANPHFGTDPGLVENIPAGADPTQLYSKPTAWQQFFNPGAVEQQGREQAAYNVAQVLSKQEADRRLNDTLAIERFRQQSATDQWQRQQEVANAEKADRNWNAVEADDRRLFNEELARKRAEEALAQENAKQGQALLNVLGHYPAWSNRVLQGDGPYTPGQQDMYRRTALAAGGSDALKEGFMSMLSRQAMLNANNKTDASPAMQAARQAAADKAGMFSVNPNEMITTTNPNLDSYRGQTVVKESIPSTIPGLPPTVVERVTAPSTILSPAKKAALEAARRAELQGQTQNVQQPVSKVSENPYREQAAAMTADTDLAADRAQLSDYVQALRNLNARIQAGGVMRSINPETAASEEFLPFTEADKLKLLKEGESLEDKRKAQLQKLSGRRPVSKQ